MCVPCNIFRFAACTVLLATLQPAAHSQNFAWVKQFASADAEEGASVATSPTGDLYTGCNFQDTADFSPGPGTFSFISKGGEDIAIIRLNAGGNVIWAKQIGGPGFEQCHDIAADAIGNVYITGTFLGVTDFDPGPGTFNIASSSSTDAFVCKLDASGNFLWAKKFGEAAPSLSMPFPVLAQSLALDNNGNVYTTGSFDGKTDFDPGTDTFYLSPGPTGSPFGTNIFITKLDAGGNFVWAKKLGGPGFAGGHAIALDELGNIYSTGFFNGTIDFDPGVATANITAPPNETVIYISKLDAAGNFVWAKDMGGRTGLALAIDGTGNVYASGEYMNDSITINKLNPSGNIIWAKQIGASIGWDMAVDNNCNLYTTGSFFGTADFDPGAGTQNMTAFSGSDCYISKLDSAGAFVWAKQMGGTNYTSGRAVAVDDLFNVYTTGTFQGTTDFDPSAATLNLPSKGLSMDMFLQKLTPVSTGIGAQELPLRSTVFPNPNAGKFTVHFDRKVDGLTLVLRDIIGRQVDRRAISNSDHVEMEIAGGSGIYLLEISDANGRKEVTRLLKN